jgi:transaldolase/glucose-6-phosphate isomerase
VNNPLLKLPELGQSIWIDYIRRDIISDGTMQRFIEEDGVRGVTSNPAIFEQAIAQSNLYDEAMMSLDETDPLKIFEVLAVQDIQAACDVFRSVYDSSNGGDGFVSLEVSPKLAHDTVGTVAEAKRLFADVNRPNVMIKVPATPAGIPAIETLIAEGLNINVTLIFSQPVHKDVCEAYVKGLERRLAAGQSVNNIASVASVFVSRIDSLVDSLLDKVEDSGKAQSLKGKAGLANLKQTYQLYKSIFHGSRFEELRNAGAATQRPLWASTSTKDPSFSDVMYVDNLIGPDTVNTLPLNTLEAFRDHGTASLTVEDGLDDASQTFQQLAEVGINIDDVMQQLLNEGVEKFVQPFDVLLESIAQKRASITT